jgi:glc operon protein GlcG
LPIVVDGQVIGAIGASFDTPEHDVEIAHAGLSAFSR